MSKPRAAHDFARPLRDDVMGIAAMTDRNDDAVHLAALGFADFHEAAVDVVRWVQTLESTQDEAARLLEWNELKGVVVVAERQTAGRGRRGHRWVDEPGASLLFTWGFRPRVPPERLALLSPLAALAIAEVINQSCDCEAGVKWPNDVLIGGKKVAGILLEARSIGGRTAVLAGAGINVSQDAAWFREAGIEDATSIARASGRAVDRHRLLVAIVQHFARIADDFERNGLTNLAGRFAELDLLRGRRVLFETAGKVLEGRVIEVSLERGIQMLAGDEPRRFDPAHVHVVAILDD